MERCNHSPSHSPARPPRLPTPHLPAPPQTNAMSRSQWDSLTTLLVSQYTIKTGHVMCGSQLNFQNYSPTTNTRAQVGALCCVVFSCSLGHQHTGTALT